MNSVGILHDGREISILVIGIRGIEGAAIDLRPLGTNHAPLRVVLDRSL
jgi:hypothetical protein